MKYKVAIASTDQKNVDLHFGRCDTFTIAEVDDKRGSYSIVEQRSVNAPCPSCGTKGDTDDAIDAVVYSLSDCGFVIVSRIGRWPDSLLYQRGIESIQYSGSIDDILCTLCSKHEAI